MKLSGATNWIDDRAERAGDAGVERADAEGQRLVERDVDAHRTAPRSDCRGSRSSRARCGCRRDWRRRRYMTSSDHEREEIEPLVGIERQAERRIRLDDDDALHAAGPVLERRRLQDLRRRDGEREGREREIDALEPQRRQAEQEAGTKQTTPAAGSVQ